MKKKIAAESGKQLPNLLISNAVQVETLEKWLVQQLKEV
ncbi:hypothetical protein QE441_003551 [Chryseobacterium sp. SORGH_AS909]|uniref:Uncharacterized protein n=1 Tax=Chryseobacterium camelliae TaxID=1265445 RepID=A0ABU0THF1_9FLAO|nr:hypothetical protein [Chryseobacterium camelliae]MDQ1100416.1 hypothetical protein [Chryseobacterium sp. SORGH_AS_1048]MDR6087757.1 hypothetical protein [Chryseobacterium sp. SORGH_AS_0909]MDR6132133.1 hypothetical protein [Chryseobacterium sp. SORGH_AS_1175]MDT3405714.1 hypothetical protein [Pseudacidovorax intermedius]